ncbi:ATP/GTP-binding protein [Streptomyces sp. NPDC058595]|uniref:ATP/GTP-binding protein n=1 Tax=Streptomyces sp. NPDC058595 TaxID=3346550 RepID=UPI00365CA966
MDSPALSRPMAAPDVVDVFTGLFDVARWLTDHWYLPLVIGGAVWPLAAFLLRHLSALASRQRMALELVPVRTFDPSPEEIFRQGVQFARASTSMPWWAPRRTKAVRIRLRADGTSALTYRIEGPAGGQRLLSMTPFGPGVRVRKAAAISDKPRRHEVRAEFLMRGQPVESLRDVPLEPDPLQPLVDAVSDLRADVGDLAEVLVDIQRAPKWALRARRAHIMANARRRERRESQRAAGWVRRDAAAVDDSFTSHLRSVATGRETSGKRMVMPPVPQRVDREQALGKLASDDQLVRVQILVMCASDMEGRAEARLSQVQAGLDVFGGRARLAMRGLRIGPWRLGADRWPSRRGFERRWQLGHCQAPAQNWVRLEELTGFLKPPTRHCRLPLMAGDLPTYQFKNPALLLQGIYRGPDGRERLVATHAKETLFELGMGKAGGGKTERALAQAIGVAHAGGGLLFMDPHRDSWPRAARFLAHADLMDRIALVDLNGGGPNSAVSSWNPIGMHHGQSAHEVVEATLDGFATALGWDDTSAPRAIAIFGAALRVLVAVNQRACLAGQPEAQATLFQVRPLLQDPVFRAGALLTAGDLLDEDTLSWWQGIFLTLPADAFGVVLNPIARLAVNPVSRAFLGRPDGVYNIRAAMDRQMVVWVCTAGNGPTDRLLTALLARDLLRAGRSRRDTPENQRAEFRVYFDELITLTGAAPETIAAMFEDFRKYRIRVHGMTQLLPRLPGAVRMSLTQNASTLATTAGSHAAVETITAEWGHSPSADQVMALDRYEHYISLTIHGRRVGPVRITGPYLDRVFAKQATSPADVQALERSARRVADALPLTQLTGIAASQLARVRTFVNAQPTAASGQDERDYQ